MFGHYHHGPFGPFGAPEPNHLTGGRRCLGCAQITFRNREDMLCPHCVARVEALAHEIELAMLDADLDMLVELDAWCRERGSSSLAMFTCASS